MAKVILFQGDSITDCGRNRDDFYSLGAGYANMVTASLGMDNPGEYTFINRGIAGNKIVDLYARIKSDFINLKPDYASIYIGVNDALHMVSTQTGVDTKKFEMIYTMLIDEILEACPDVKLMIIAPYVLEGTATCDTEEIPNRLARYRSEVAEKVAVAKKMAEKYDLPLIELQPAFDEACQLAAPKYWSSDGVHPTACGHEIIKRKWLAAFEILK